MVEHKFEKYITFVIVEGCSERCADATLEEESPHFITMTFEKFLKENERCK